MKGDLDAAMKIYEQIIADSNAERSSIAEAMFRLGMCHMKMRDEQQARLVFEKLVTQYPDQAAIVEKAQPILDEISNPDPASLMPANTIMYIEAGSPGKQIETLLKMLEGTPLENPLAAIPAIGGPGGPPPGAIAALFNPSMMKELKKIRGFAVGVSGVGNQPPITAVFFPGKSDALRGLLLAAIGMAGQPSEVIEGMNVVGFGQAGIAYDEDVIIAGQPMEQLEWSIKQYKGITSAPSLLSENKAFGKLSRKSREDNLITVWLNAQSMYPLLIEQAGHLPDFRLVDTLVDFESIEEAMGFISLAENEILVEASVQLKQGHNCLPLNLIRTPNLSTKGFEAVPSNAVAVAGFALGESESVPAAAVEQKIKQLTGLDIGRELFANIEQVTVFITEPTSEAKSSVLGQYVSPVMPSIGIAIRSNNPAQTKSLLSKLLKVFGVINNTNMTSSEINETVADDVEGKYMIGAFDEKPVYCYMKQSGQNTILSFSSETAQACVKAVESGQNVLSGGPLQSKLSAMSPDASKLLLINHGGIVRLLNEHIHREYDSSEPLPYSDILKQLADVFARTSLEVSTGETENSFKVRASISDIPPAQEIFPIAMQLAGGMPRNLTTKAVEPEPADGVKISPAGQAVLEWVPGAMAESHKVYLGSSRESLNLLVETDENEYEELGELKEDGTYYWRVDELAEDGTVTEGEVWNFSVGKMVFSKKSADSWLSGGEGKGIEFNGVDDYIDVEIDEPMEQMTISMWFKFNQIRDWESDSGGGGMFASLISSDDDDEAAGAVHFNINGYDMDLPVFELTVYSESGMSSEYLTETRVEAGRWYHVVATYDNPSSEVRLYINGQLEEQEVWTVGPVVIGKAAIGTWRDNGWFFDGFMDDIRIYNYAMDEEEASKLYVSPYATAPEPADGERVAPKGPGKLRWKAGIGSVGHKLYFVGGDPKELSMLAELEESNFSELPVLFENDVYYWRIDEVQQDGSVIEGDVWSFTTGGMIAHWKFDETSGRLASDSAGAHDGILHGEPAWTSDGKIGGALEFDGKDSHVDIDVPGQMEQMTIAMWLKYDTVEGESPSEPDSFRFLISRNHYIDTGSVHLNLSSVHFNLVNIEDSVFVDFNVNVMMQEFQSESSLEAGRWYHVAATYDNPNQTAKIYINGQVDSISTNDTGAPALIGEAAIGDWLDPFYETDRHFDGVLDDVRIYDSVLSAEDIAELYKNTGTAQSEPTLTSTKHTVRRVHLPDADKITGAVLDLANGDLLDAGEGDDHLIGRFTELRKGDIAYDTVESGHAIICVRNAKAEKPDGDKRIVLNPDEQTADVKAYKLDKVPCVLIITDQNRREYLLSIISADDEEMVLEYTLLSSRAR
ncbi:MAG: LamG-like jellyroll fold domain-containing protein [Planctomycetota bacterium]